MSRLLWAIVVIRVFFAPGGLFKDDRWYFVGKLQGTDIRVSGDTIFPILEGDKLELKCEEDKRTCWYGRA